MLSLRNFINALPNTPVREPVKNYLADFSVKGGAGVPPLSAKGFWAG